MLTAIADTVSFVLVKLEPLTDTEWDLDAVCAQAADVLAATGAGATDARVRDVPDARTVRYYQSIGLLDRPVRYDGRKAIYGYRHLLQMVCVKLLQAQGLSLAQVQQALAVASTAQLARAVDEAMAGRVVSTPPPVTSPATPAAAPTPWQTLELVPGVLVTVDPHRHPDTEALFSRLKLSLSQPPVNPVTPKLEKHRP